MHSDEAFLFVHRQVVFCVFLAFDFFRFCMVIRFLSLPQQTMTSYLEGYRQVVKFNSIWKRETTAKIKKRWKANSSTADMTSLVAVT